MAASSEGSARSPMPESGPGWLPPIRLPVHTLTRYLRVRLGVAEGVLRWEVPRTLLGLVPVGMRRTRVPIGEVRSTRVRMVVHPLHALAGGACIALPLAFGFGWGAVPLVVVGAWVVLVSFGPHVEVATFAGKRHRAGVCYSHRFDGEMYATAVNDLAGQARPPAPGGAAD